MLFIFLDTYSLVTVNNLIYTFNNQIQKNICASEYHNTQDNWHFFCFSHFSPCRKVRQARDALTSGIHEASEELGQLVSTSVHLILPAPEWEGSKELWALGEIAFFCGIREIKCNYWVVWLSGRLSLALLLIYQVQW